MQQSQQLDDVIKRFQTMLFFYTSLYQIASLNYSSNRCQKTIDLSAIYPNRYQNTFCIPPALFISNNYNNMKKYISLKENYECVLKQSTDRRRETEQFIWAVSKRIETEENYAKSLQNIGKMVQKFITRTTISSLTFSAFQLSNSNRAIQAKAFCKSLKEEVLNVLKESLNSQNLQFKSIEKQIRRLEKQLANHIDIIRKTKYKILDAEKDNEQLINFQIAQAVTGLTKEKKNKLKTKSKDIYKDILIYQQNYNQAFNEYHNFRGRYFSEMDKFMQNLEQHEIHRIQKQTDTIMKILIFETSMIKNFQYDINNISQQMSNKDPLHDINYFVELNEEELQIQKLPVLYNQLKDRTMMRQTLYKMINNEFHDKIEYDKNKQIRKFIENKFKKQAPQKQIKSPDVELVIEFVRDRWEGLPITQQNKQKFVVLMNIAKNRHIALMFLQQIQYSFKFQMLSNKFNQILGLFQLLLISCKEHKDVFVGRKLINLLFTFYVKCDCLANEGKICTQKIYLWEKIDLENLYFLQNQDFWETSVFQSIQQQLHCRPRPLQESEQESIMREKSIILGQLASFCHNIVMFGMAVKNARAIIGKFCRLYNIPEEQNKDLARSIAVATRKYKQKEQMK